MNADKLGNAVNIALLRLTELLKVAKGLVGSYAIWLSLRCPQPPQLPVILLMLTNLLNTK